MAVGGGALILAFPDEGFAGAGVLAAGRGLDARDTPILAFPRKGGRDPLASIWAWFRQTYPCKPVKGEGIYRSRFLLGFGWRPLEWDFCKFLRLANML